jgi:aryl-alcohol dehydrogenase-like predicted oxidoreductase
MSQPLTQLEYSLVERTSEADLLPMAWHHGITPTAWSPLAGGVLSGKYSQGDSKANDDSARQGMLQSMGQLNDRSLAIADVVKQVATKVNRTPSQVALNWLLQQPGRPIQIIGVRKLTHLEDNLGALDFTLSVEHLDKLTAASSFALPFPHSFIASDMYHGVVDGKNSIESGFSVYD